MPTSRHLDRRLRLNLLRAVVAIESNRSLTGASAQIGVSQPSLTKSLNVLEDLVQTSLFERHARGVHITPAGAAVARTANVVLAELKRLEVVLDRLAGSDDDSLSFGVLPTAASGVLPGVITRLSHSHPRLRIRFEEGLTEELLPLLAEGKIEFIVGRLYEPVERDEFVREALWDEPFAFLARIDHPLFQGPATLESVSKYSLIFPSTTQRLGQETDQFLSTLEASFEIAYRSNSFGFIREILQETDKLSVMPSLMMAGDLVRESLKIVPLVVRSPPRPAGIITVPDHEMTTGGHAFVGALRQYVSEILRPREN